MGYKATILLVIVAFVTFAHSKPQPKEEIPRPYLWLTESVVCERGVDCADLKYNSKVRAELKSLEYWIGDLNAYGKANWRQEYPETAQRYDELTIIAKQLPEDIPAPPVPGPAKIVMCEEGKQKECRAAQAELDRPELNNLNRWISGLSAFGQANWRKQYPETAEKYDRISKNM